MKSVCIVIALVMLIAVPLSLFSDEDGAALFKAKCSTCHGANGEGKPAAKIPALKGTSLTADQIVALLTNGASDKKMHAKPLSGLTADQAKAVAAYVKTLK